MTKTLRALVALVVVALAVAGCGSSSGSGSGTDTARLAPANSFLYFEATIDPTGDQEAAMRTILADLPGSGPPEDRINNLLEQASKSSKTANVDYEKDIKPWLGDKAAVFVAPPKTANGKSPWAIVAATTDEGKAKDTVKKGHDAGDQDLTYRDTDYVLSKDGTAVGVVGGYLVIGSDDGLKAAVDASKNDSASLTKSDRYQQAIKGATTDRIALLYEDFGGILQTLASASKQSLGAAAPLVGRLFGGNPIVATIRAENQALVIDGSLLPSGSLFGISGKSTPLLGTVPADSWLALGAPHLGQTLETVIGLVSGAVGGEQALKQQLRASTGLDLDRDLLSWIGDAAIYVTGDSKATIGGGALIQSTNPTASRRALTKLAALAARSGGDTRVSAYHFHSAAGYRLQTTSAPTPIYIVQAGDEVALTYGPPTVLGGSGAALTSAPGYQAAVSKLGAGYAPSLYVSVPPILNVAESFGAGGASYQKAKPYLTILDYLISGSAQSDGKTISRTRIGFKPHL
jgi:hypothetical protein